MIPTRVSIFWESKSYFWNILSSVCKQMCAHECGGQTPTSVVFLNLPAPNFLMQNPSPNQELTTRLSRLASSSGLSFRDWTQVLLCRHFTEPPSHAFVSYRAILEMRGWCFTQAGILPSAKWTPHCGKALREITAFPCNSSSGSQQETGRKAGKKIKISGIATWVFNT